MTTLHSCEKIDLKSMFSSGESEHAGLVDDVPPTAPDWANMARAAWDAPGWQAAAAEYHNKNHQSAAKIEPERLQRLHRLMDNDVSLERAWSELNDQRRRGEAAATTVEAVMFGLRRGVGALQEPATRRRLSELNEEQVCEVYRRVQQFKHAPAWTEADADSLLDLWNDHVGQVA
jgi:tRNA A37 N6-isopentenylltransferase MiaA